MSLPAGVEDIVFQLARHGLTEVAKSLQNTPAQIAQAAAALEQWRADCVERAKEPQPVDAPKAAP